MLGHSRIRSHCDVCCQTLASPCGLGTVHRQQKLLVQEGGAAEFGTMSGIAVHDWIFHGGEQIVVKIRYN